MGFDALLRGAIGTIDTVTKSLQTTVTIFPWLRDGGRGPERSPFGITVRAIVERKDEEKFTAVGVVLVIKATVLILEIVPPTEAEGRQNPIDPRDLVVLSDGSSAPIIGNPGLLDPTSDQQYFAELTIGGIREP